MKKFVSTNMILILLGLDKYQQTSYNLSHFLLNPCNHQISFCFYIYSMPFRRNFRKAHMTEISWTPYTDLREDLISSNYNIVGKVKSIETDWNFLRIGPYIWIFCRLWHLLNWMERGVVWKNLSSFTNQCLLQTYPAAGTVYYTTSFNPHNNSVNEYYYLHFMRKETDP